MTPDNKAKITEEAYRKASIYTPKYLSCSLGTNLALQDAFGKRDESMFKAASGLHGGIGGKGDVCGALMGVSLMLGFMFGKSKDELDSPETAPELGKQDDSTRLVGEIYDWFEKEFGSVKCNVIKERNQKEVEASTDTTGMTETEITMLIHQKCDVLAGKTAAKAAELIYDEMAKGKK